MYYILTYLQEKCKKEGEMEKNYINYQGQTYFYVNVKKKTYGIVVSQKDSKNADNIIKQGLLENMKTINAWKKEWKEGVA